MFPDSRKPEDPVSPVPMPTKPGTGSSGGLDSGQKAGIAIGVLLAIALIAGLVYIIIQRGGVSMDSVREGMGNVRERLGNIANRPTAKHERFDTPGETSNA